MATKDDSSTSPTTSNDMVVAWGDNGPELTPRDEVVEIPMTPVGEGNLWIPATVQWFSTIRKGGVPTRLRRIRRAESGKHVIVEFDCTPFMRFTLDDRDVIGDWASCAVRNQKDAKHAIFDALPARERARIARAVANLEPTP